MGGLGVLVLPLCRMVTSRGNSNPSEVESTVSQRCSRPDIGNPCTKRLTYRHTGTPSKWLIIAPRNRGSGWPATHGRHAVRADCRAPPLGQARCPSASSTGRGNLGRGHGCHAPNWATTSCLSGEVRDGDWTFPVGHGPVATHKGTAMDQVPTAPQAEQHCLHRRRHHVGKRVTHPRSPRHLSHPRN